MPLTTPTSFAVSTRTSKKPYLASSATLLGCSSSCISMLGVAWLDSGLSVTPAVCEPAPLLPDDDPDARNEMLK